MSASAALDLDLRRAAQTFANKLDDIKAQYVQRDDAVDVIALALLCREHVLLIGPPGTAKTALVEHVTTMLRATYFSHLLTKFTEPAELFGAIDVEQFQQDSVYRVNTEGMLPHAQIAFLDEIFNGSSAILNTLLTLIHERVFYNGSARQESELITLLGASNEMTDDPVLRAFSDRFLFRIRLDYVGDDHVEDVLRLGWEVERRQLAGALVPPAQGTEPATGSAAEFPMSQLRTLQRALGDIELSGVRHALASILRSCREEAVAFSDRRAVKAQKAIAAQALLHGRAQARDEDLAVLAHMWANSSDEKALRTIVESHGIPMTSGGGRVRDEQEIRIDVDRLNRVTDESARPEELREVLRRLSLLRTETQATYPTDSALLYLIQQAQRVALEKLHELGM